MTDSNLNAGPTVSTPLDKSNERIKAMFGGIAPSYDLLNHVLSLNIDKTWRRFTVRQLNPKPGDKILDACTGTGDLAIGFADALTQHASNPDRTKLPAGSEIVATDFTPQMLAIARKKSATKHPAIEWHEADTQKLPLASDRFDIVTVAFGLRNVADPMLGLRELIRVTKPGGRVAILEFSKPNVQPFRALYLAYFKHVLPRIGQSVSKSKDSAYSYLPASVMTFPDGETMLETMRAAGLCDCVRHPLTFGIATLYIGTKSTVAASKSASASSAP